MRFDGTLASWDDDSGYGFIRPAKGGQDIFAHISAFPRDGVRPAAGEFVSFEVELNADGKKRAKAIMRPRRTAPARLPGKLPGPRFPARAAALLLIVIAVAFSYRARAPAPASPAAGAPLENAASVEAVEAVEAAPLARFQCDERRYCSQMTSCDEAEYFLQNCPGVEMDGNRDGEPCERQCTSGNWRGGAAGGR